MNPARLFKVCSSCSLKGDAEEPRGQLFCSENDFSNTNFIFHIYSSIASFGITQHSVLMLVSVSINTALLHTFVALVCLLPWTTFLQNIILDLCVINISQWLYFCRPHLIQKSAKSPRCLWKKDRVTDHKLWLQRQQSSQSLLFMRVQLLMRLWKQ